MKLRHNHSFKCTKHRHHIAPNSTTAKASNTSTEYQYIRYFFLCALCIQNSSYTLLRRWSTGISMENASDSSILIGDELIKLSVPIFMTFFSPMFGINFGNAPMPDGKMVHLNKIIKTSVIIVWIDYHLWHNDVLMPVHLQLLLN